MARRAGRRISNEEEIKRVRVFAQPTPEQKLIVWRSLLEDPRWVDYFVGVVDEKVKGLRSPPKDLYLRAPVAHSLRTGEVCMPASRLTKYERSKLIRRLEAAREKLTRKFLQGGELTDFDIDALDTVVELTWIGRY